MEIRYLTVGEAAERLAVSNKTIRRLIERGELDAIQLPLRGGLRVSEQALRDFVERNEVAL